MKILFLAQLPPPIHGPSKISRLLLDCLEKENSIAVDYLNISTSKSLYNIGALNFIKIKRLIIIYFKLLKLLFNNKYDLIYISMAISDNAFFKDLIFLVVSKIFIRRRIIHFHSAGLKKRLLSSKFPYIISKLYSIIFKNCELIHLSKLLLKDLDINHFENIHILPNGINDRFEPYNSNFEKKYQVLFLSNLIESKGIFVLLEALNNLKKIKFHFKACIAGASYSDSTNIKLKNLIEDYKLQNNIDILGPVYGVEKFNLLYQSQILVFPTLLDCMPLTILEAMSFGIPVISTNVGAISEILDNGNCGILIKKNDSLELSHSILNLLKNKKQFDLLSRKGRFRFEEKYRSEYFFDNFKKILFKNF